LKNDWNYEADNVTKIADRNEYLIFMQQIEYVHEKMLKTI